MIAVLLVSHGTYSKALLETAEMILGKQEDAAAVGLSASQSPDQLKEKIRMAIEKLKGKELLVLTDVTSGTPFNMVMALSQEYSFRHLTGINLPLLIDALISRQAMSLDDLAKSLMEHAAGTFVDVDEKMSRAQNQNEDDF